MARGRMSWQQLAWISAIAITGLSVHPYPILAQVAGDGTLGTQVNGSLTIPCTGTCIITNGSTRGRNLFHSFRQFSLPNGDFAGFVTDPAIQNVIVRVTGQGNAFISNINGTIATVNATVTAVNPTNFFLLNPNGIIFGPNAQVLIGGSFLATTANRMQFADGTQFSTNNPAPLLTVSVPIGLQFNAAPGTIQMQGANLSAVNRDSFSGFALVGGDVTLDNSSVTAPGQRIELGAVGANGAAGLRLNGDRLNDNFASDAPRRDITLTNNSLINVLASNGGGELIATGRNIVLDGSVIVTGISAGVDNAITNQAGNITINASANLLLSRRSLIYDLVNSNAAGQGGNTNITATDVRVLSGSGIVAETRGNGNTGNVSVTANTIAVDGATPDGLISSIGSQVGLRGNGRGGNVTIETGSLTVSNGATISASTFGNGNAGNVQVTAKTIDLDGITPNGRFASGIFSTVQIGSGNAGNVTIKTGSLTITNGAAISAGTNSRGNGGNVQVTADSIRLDGIAPSGLFVSIIGSQVGRAGRGNGGNVNVKTDLLTVTNGASIFASTLGNGNAGNIQVKANTIAFDGTEPSGQSPSGIASQVAPTGVGRGGDVVVETDLLALTNGGGISAATLGNGNAGNIRVKANTITLGSTTPSRLSSAIVSAVAPTGVGRGGDVVIETDLLTLTNGAGISAGTFGQGNAGNIFVTASRIDASGGGQVQTSTSSSSNAGSMVLKVRDRLTLSGANTSLLANTTSGSSGNGGSIFIDPSVITIQDGATIAVDSQGSGTGGNITIQAGRLELRDRGSITAETASAQGGNIALDVKDLLLMRRNSLISATAGTAQGAGDGGNITIRAPFVIGVLSENSDIIANAFTGRGGNITINTNGIYGFRVESQLTPFSDISASSQFGLSGTVAITTLNVDPNRGLVALPVNFTDPSRQISQACKPGSKTSASSFVATGRGGIPLSPDEPLESRAVVTKWVPLPEEGGEWGSGGTIQNPKSKIGSADGSPEAQNPIIEAQGWIVTADGTVELVANLPSSRPVDFSTMSGACQPAP